MIPVLCFLFFLLPKRGEEIHGSCRLEGAGQSPGKLVLEKRNSRRKEGQAHEAEDDQEILAESFRELAESKSVDRITVQEIVDNCDYSTATFYRHFKDKNDLIAWDYARKTAEIMGRINGKDYSWAQTLRDGAEHYSEEKEYLANLLLHTSGHDAFIQYMADINYGEMGKHILSVIGKDALDEKTAMLIRTYCLGTVCLSCEWILGKYQATPEELAEIYESTLPQPLRELVMKEK